MTIKGRTTPRWGRDKSARWDSHAENGFRTRSYPALTQVAPPAPPPTERVELPGRPGAAERDMTLALHRAAPTGGDLLTIVTHGWTTAEMCLTTRQIHALRDALNTWFPPDA